MQNEFSDSESARKYSILEQTGNAWAMGEVTSVLIKPGQAKTLLSHLHAVIFKE